MPTPPDEGGAARMYQATDGTAEDTPTPPDNQALLRCAGCSCAGHAPVLVYDKAAAPLGVVLRPCFDWHPDGRPALLCASCKRGFNRNRGRARYSARRPSDGRMTGGAL
jgi:hypothetical protein